MNSTVVYISLGNALLLFMYYSNEHWKYLLPDFMEKLTIIMTFYRFRFAINKSLMASTDDIYDTPL